MNIRDDISPAFLARVAAVHRRRQAFLQRLEMQREFPGLGRPAQRQLRSLITRRKAAGQWPPSGDEVDTDAELLDAMNAAHEEESQYLITGPVFKAAVREHRARQYPKQVLARHAWKKERELEIRRAVFRCRARKILGKGV